MYDVLLRAQLGLSELGVPLPGQVLHVCCRLCCPVYCRGLPIGCGGGNVLIPWVGKGVVSAFWQALIMTVMSMCSIDYEFYV